MAVATEVITLYNDIEELIVAEVKQGEQYFIPQFIKLYKGSVEDFRKEYPSYELENETD